MRPDGMNLGNDAHRGPRLGGGESSPLPGEAGANDQYVVLRHAAGHSIQGWGRGMSPPSRIGPPAARTTGIEGVNPGGSFTYASYGRKIDRAPGGSGCRGACTAAAWGGVARSTRSAGLEPDRDRGPREARQVAPRLLRCVHRGASGADA